MILLDSNILIRLMDRRDVNYQAVRKALSVLEGRGEILVIVPQNLYEFWAVATRATGMTARANGLGLSSSQADRWANYF